MENALSDVQATFLSLDAQYNVLLAGCKTQAQRDALYAQYAAAQQNYQSTLNATLTDDDAQVTALSTQLKAANAQVVQATAQLGNISKVINDITTAVSLGAQLVAMA
jgi:hypothetical protein